MNLSPFVISIAILGSFSATQAIAKTAQLQSEVISSSEIQWGYLNPLRGDKSPGAANLWGDRTKNMPTGMLVKFNKGFSSPPHIHNITYRGIVIKGQMHNDDPDAATMWMPTGSFWTQPAGENHITSANGEANTIFLEIDSGPYLVKPSDQHFDNGEKPINLHESNHVWLNPTDVSFINGNDVQMTALWGSNADGQLGGTMVKIPAGYKGEIDVDAEEFRGIVIAGNLQYRSAETENAKALNAGSYFGSTGQFSHNIEAAENGATIYIRTDGKYQLNTQP
ncbi:DUF4437 domain-containing protein [Shewanella sp. 10N.7]|uniref:DUF4437 domain-containing protein n=1 Tax=Shewanella sp. 10N.7 TaxID=2885093 RepID=UPI001E3082CE|nr:DUF4437 domain-containing protein [Shewanella sp. 10N.7]MCC4834431.1 DUF4437 domain-containing protein [Shewanella sp. 10N.7]